MAGRLAEAEKVYRQILAANPSHPDATHLLGVIAHQIGRNDAAEDLIKRAIALNPKCPQFHYHLGMVMQAVRRLDEAASAYSSAIQLNPSHAEAFLNLGNTFLELGRLDEAGEVFRQAIRVRPDYPLAYSNLGIVLKKQGKFTESISLYHRAIALKPDFADAYSNLTVSLTELRQLDEAIAVAKKAIALAPDSVESYNNLAMALAERGRLDEASAAASEALKRKPDLAEPHLIMGNVRMDQGRVEEAIAYYERAAALKPDDPRLESNRLYALHFHPAYDARRLYDEHRKYNEKFAKPLARSIVPHAPPGPSARKLRIGYVSADLRTHPIGRFILPALQHHDRNQFEIFCYSDSRMSDAMTAKLAGYCSGWREIAGWSDERAAKLIRDDAIDILVDLTMHMANGRPLTFARKPAPVQVSYLAYCSTMGLDAIDYRLTDPHLDPPGDGDACYSEQSIRLPETYWCYDPGMPTPDISPLPALESGHITFGCLNNFSKASKDALATWRRLLESVPGSRLLLYSLPGSHRDDAIQFMTRTGLDASRIAFVGKTPGPEYFALYGKIDIALDPFPCAGGTTTCDALWMGVPVVTLAGRTAVGRSGVSLLSNVGLRQLVAGSPDEYVRIAAELARDLPSLAALRQGLRNRMLQSPLTDATRFARNIENTYREMWRQWREKNHAR